MESGQDVKQPDIVRGPNQKEAECDDDTRQVSYDKGIFTVVAVGNHTSDGTDEEWGEHTDDEQAADSESGLGEYRNERSGSDKIEPIPQETDNLSKPEQAKVTVATNQLAVSNWSAAVGCCCAQGESPRLR